MLLDEILPQYDFTDVHAIKIKASQEVAYRAFTQITLSEISGIVRLLFFLRELPWKIARKEEASLTFDIHKPMLSQMLTHNFTLITEQAPEEIVFGLIVSRKIGTFVDGYNGTEKLPENPEEFLAFHHPDYLSVVANFLITPAETPGFTIVRTESRTKAWSPQAKKDFTPYWRIIRPFSGLIRELWLRGIQRRAIKISPSEETTGILFIGGLVK
jgi:hypothetical protein